MVTLEGIQKTMRTNTEIVIMELGTRKEKRFLSFVQL